MTSILETVARTINKINDGMLAGHSELVCERSPAVAQEIIDNLPIIILPHDAEPEDWDIVSFIGISDKSGGEYSGVAHFCDLSGIRHDRTSIEIIQRNNTPVLMDNKPEEG